MSALKTLYFAFLVTISAPSFGLSIDDFNGNWILSKSGCVEPYETPRDAGFFFEYWEIADGQFKHRLDFSDNDKFPDCKDVFSSGTIGGTAVGSKLQLIITTTRSKSCHRTFSNMPATVFRDDLRGEELKETFELSPDKGMLFDETSSDPKLNNGCTRVRNVFIRNPGF